MASVVQGNVGESEIVFDGTLGGKFLFLQFAVAGMHRSGGIECLIWTRYDPADVLIRSRFPPVGDS
jgi:hypothetical protein